MKTFTLGEFIDAIEKDGLEQAFGNLFRTEDNLEINISGRKQVWTPEYRGFKIVKRKVMIGAACALGQGFINTNIYPIGGYEERNKGKSDLWNEFESAVVEANDNDKLPLPEIAAKMRVQFEEHLNVTFKAKSFDYASSIKKIEDA